MTSRLCDLGASKLRKPWGSIVGILIVGSSKESMHRRGGITAAAILSVTLRPLVVSALFLFLFSLTLGVSVLILCDRRLRMKFKGFIVNRTQQHFVPPELSQWLLIPQSTTKVAISIRKTQSIYKEPATTPKVASLLCRDKPLGRLGFKVGRLLVNF